MADQGRTIRLPVHLVEQVNKLARVKRDLHQQLGREATHDELAKECGLTPEKVADLLDHARDYLRRVLQTLGPDIDTGRSIVVLEPSCASVFRDELRNLFPDDPRADRLRRQTFLLSEFLEHHASGYTPPRLARSVLLHGHCHHKAIMKMTDEESLLRKMGVTLESPDAGCCGMAGPFGFGADTFAISQAIGERVLLPAVRRAPPDALIVSDGFSCREQIVQATGRQALHLAEVIQLAARPSHAETGS